MLVEEEGLPGLRRRLRRLHAAAGRPTLRRLHEQASLAGLTLPTSTAHELLAGRGRPRWATVEAFVVAAVEHARSRRPPAELPDHLDDLRAWRRLYERVDEYADPAPAVASNRAIATDGESRSTYVGFVLAVDSAHGALREVARTRSARPGRWAAANRAVNASGIYAERERLLASGAPAVVAAGERLFLRLVRIRDAVCTGARLESNEYHHAYHPFADALWLFRMAVRIELGQPPLTPQALDRVDWSDHERCANCTQSAT